MGIEKTLKRAEVFLGLDDSDLEKIAALPSCREEAYEAEAGIFRAGDKAEYLYVLEEGQVDLVVDVLQWSREETRPTAIDIVTKGGFFGWSAVVRPHFYVMSAVCRKPSRVVVISGAELMVLFEVENHIGYKVFQSLSHVVGARLRDIERLLISGERWPFFQRRRASGT